MPEPVDVTTADHYVWGQVSDGWRLLDSPGLSVIEERVPAGAGEEWPVHDTATQFFYVLEGLAQMRTVEGVVELGSREGIEIPTGLAHRFFNPGPAETRFLVISSPNTRGDRRAVDIAS